MQNDIVKQAPDQKPETSRPKVDVMTTGKPAPDQKSQSKNQSIDGVKQLQTSESPAEDDEIKPDKKKHGHPKKQIENSAPKTSTSSNKPVAAVSVAIVICLAMISLVIYAQITS